MGSPDAGTVAPRRRPPAPATPPAPGAPRSTTAAGAPPPGAAPPPRRARSAARAAASSGGPATAPAVTPVDAGPLRPSTPVPPPTPAPPHRRLRRLHPLRGLRLVRRQQHLPPRLGHRAQRRSHRRMGLADRELRPAAPRPSVSPAARRPTGSSGSLCVGSSATTAFCSAPAQLHLPRGYACNARLASGQMVCVPGTNRCVMDSGTPPPVDSGIPPDQDVGVRVDTGTRVDTGVRVDVGVAVDAGTPIVSDLGVVLNDAGTARATTPRRPSIRVSRSGWAFRPTAAAAAGHVPGPVELIAGAGRVGPGRDGGSAHLDATPPALTGDRRRRRHASPRPASPSASIPPAPPLLPGVTAHPRNSDLGPVSQPQGGGPGRSRRCAPGPSSRGRWP